MPCVVMRRQITCASKRDTHVWWRQGGCLRTKVHVCQIISTPNGNAQGIRANMERCRGGPAWVYLAKDENDAGSWWPGFFVCHSDDALLNAAVRYGGAKQGAFYPGGRLSKAGASIDLFFVLCHGLVEAEQWRAYDEAMSREDDRTFCPQLAEANQRMHRIMSTRSDDTAPATPSTVCASTCSTVTPGLAPRREDSDVSASSGSRTFHGSPARSVSSASTDLDVALTQQDPGADDSPDSDTSSTFADGRDSLSMLRGRAGGEGGGVTGSFSVKNRGAQAHEARCPTRHSPNAERNPLEGHRGANFATAGKRAGEEGLGSSPSKRSCAWRQFPRLSTSSAPQDGCVFRRKPLVKDSSKDMDVERSLDVENVELRKARENEQPDSSCEQDRLELQGKGTTDSRRSDEALQNGRIRLQPKSTLHVSNTENGGSRSSPPRLPGVAVGQNSDSDDNQLQSETCRSAALPAVEESGSSESRTWLSRVENRRTRSSKADDIHARDASKAPVLQALNNQWQGDQRLTIDTPLVDQRLDEARALSEEGVTGEEDSKTLSKLLLRLKWRWRPARGLETGFWLVRAGANMKTAEEGVDKFREGDIVRYVRGVLGLQGASALHSCSEEESEDRDEEEDKEEEEEGEEEEEEAVDGDGNNDEKEEGDMMRVQPEGGSEQDARVPLAGKAAGSAFEQPIMPEGRTLQAALGALHPSNAPGILKQRTAEFSTVLQFVTSRVAEPSGGSLYLCGCPGTGKTQTMIQVQAEVQRMADKESFPRPEFHAFTGTAFTNPNAMHRALWVAITGGMDVPSNIEKALGKRLKLHRKPTSNSPMIVVVVDEIDQLLSHNHEELLRLFEWADAPKSRLVLVGIANSIEFDVGFSNLSRKPDKVLFRAYTPQDLVSILTERAGMALQPPAIQLCSKKIAATHGDARRAISVCREAVVVARRELQEKLDSAVTEEEREGVGQREGIPIVTIRHMVTALKAVRACQYGDAISALSVQAQVILCVAAAMTATISDAGPRSEGTKPAKVSRLTQGDLHDKCTGVWRTSGSGASLNQVEFSGAIDILAAQGLVKVKGKRNTFGRNRQLALQIDVSDVEIALGDQPFFKRVSDR